MAIACRIIRDQNGSVEYISNEEGTRSALFDDLVGVSNKEIALDLYALTETQEFKDLNPMRTTEPTLQEVIAFATRKNSALSTEQKIDLDNSAIALNLSSYGALLNAMRKTFIKNEVVVFDRLSMERSGLYNQYEINSILEDESLQERIKNTISGMTNTSDESLPEYETLFVVSETSRLNSLGKMEVTNPFTTELKVSQQIAGTQIEDSIDSVSYEPIKNSYYTSSKAKNILVSIANKNKPLKVKSIVDGILVDKTENNPVELLKEVLDLASAKVLSDKITYIQNINSNIWDSSKNAVYTLLKDLKIAALESGVDLLDIQDAAFTKTKTEVVNILNSFQTLLNNPRQDTIEEFSSEYVKFFDLNQNPQVEIVETTNADNIYLDTDLSEYELFTKHGLIKQGDNVYQPVEVMESVDEVYSIISQNTQVLPEGIETESDLRDYVQQQMNTVDLTDFQVDSTELEKMLLYKMYFNSPQFQKPTLNNRNRFLQFTGDYSYLTEEYPSDFYKVLLKEKNKNSPLYNNFYKYFTVTKNGIELIQKDPLTIRNVMRYASEDLKQYNLVSKNLGLPVEEISEDVVDFNEMIYNRQQAISNPTSISKLNKDYTVLSPVTIAVKNATDSFVRTPAGVFEIDYQIGNVTFYNLLPKGDSRYNSLGQFKTKTQSDLNLNDFSYLQDKPEAFTRAQNYYSKSELERINEQYFGCL